VLHSKAGARAVTGANPWRCEGGGHLSGGGVEGWCLRCPWGDLAPDVMLGQQTLLNCAAFKGWGQGCDGAEPLEVSEGRGGGGVTCLGGGSGACVCGVVSSYVMLGRQTLLKCAALKGWGQGCDGGEPLEASGCVCVCLGGGAECVCVGGGRGLEACEGWVVLCLGAGCVGGLCLRCPCYGDLAPDVMLGRQTLLNCAAFKGWGQGVTGANPWR
jgi:hypothetical protein